MTNHHRPFADHRLGRLTWTRSANGTWSTGAAINGEAGAFEAFAYRVADGLRGATMWRVDTFTNDRALDSVTARTLADAKDHAQAVYETVEGVNL